MVDGHWIPLDPQGSLALGISIPQSYRNPAQLSHLGLADVVRRPLTIDEAESAAGILILQQQRKSIGTNCVIAGQLRKPRQTGRDSDGGKAWMPGCRERPTVIHRCAYGNTRWHLVV
jgi:hypothetical protein